MWGKPLTGHTTWLWDVAFSPDGQRLAAAGADRVQLWTMDTGTLTGRSFGKPLVQPPMVLAVTFSPDSQMVATGGEAGVRLWDAASQEPLRQPLTGHTDRVLTVRFNPDGRTLATGGEDRTIRLWDVETHRPLGQPFASDNTVWAVAFSPDGSRLASGDTDGTGLVWDVDPKSWQARACQIANRNLSRTEWERYLGDEPYRPTCPGLPMLASEGSSAAAAEPPPTPLPMADLTYTQTAVIVEEFDTDQGFIQTSPNVYIADGQVYWHIERSAGQQYVYRPIPAFNGNVRLTVRGQVNSWTNNCDSRVGIGDEPGNGIIINFGWTGGGCPTNGPLIDAPRGVKLERYEQDCQFRGDWLWVKRGTPYTASLTIIDEAARLEVKGVGSSAGTVKYKGPYTTLWVGNKGNNDWPECTGRIDTVIVEPLD